MNKIEKIINEKYKNLVYKAIVNNFARLGYCLQECTLDIFHRANTNKKITNLKNFMTQQLTSIRQMVWLNEMSMKIEESSAILRIPLICEPKTIPYKELVKDIQTGMMERIISRPDLTPITPIEEINKQIELELELDNNMDHWIILQNKLVKYFPKEKQE